jgi:Mn-dependent DtxR family transcriptional regulator
MGVKDKIMAHLRDIKIAARTVEIAQAVGEDERTVQDALLELDDADMVIMRNGWYFVSAKGMQA